MQHPQMGLLTSEASSETRNKPPCPPHLQHCHQGLFPMPSPPPSQGSLREQPEQLSHSFPAPILGWVCFTCCSLSHRLVTILCCPCLAVGHREGSHLSKTTLSLVTEVGLGLKASGPVPSPTEKAGMEGGVRPGQEWLLGPQGWAPAVRPGHRPVQGPAGGASSPH